MGLVHRAAFTMLRPMPGPPEKPALKQLPSFRQRRKDHLRCWTGGEIKTDMEPHVQDRPCGVSRL